MTAYFLHMIMTVINITSCGRHIARISTTQKRHVMYSLKNVKQLLVVSSDNGWWEAKHLNSDKCGYVPSTYVENDDSIRSQEYANYASIQYYVRHKIM